MEIGRLRRTAASDEKQPATVVPNAGAKTAWSHDLEFCS
jgi:hypothetical protein